MQKTCNCRVSTDISGALSCGTGKLDFYGFWEFPCTHGLAEYLEWELAKNNSTPKQSD